MNSSCISLCFTKLWRRKSADSVTSETRLNRCLGLFDLIVIGVGGMVGSGIYVMTGFAIRDQAGPSVVISFLLAAVIVLLIAACYTELASKLHKTGSTYLYLYLTIGEFPAFIIGFSTLIMICLGGSVNARAWSLYLDSLCNGAISNFTIEWIAEWNTGPPIARYPDFLAVIVIVVLTVVISLGANFSTKFSTVFVAINLGVLSVVTVCGFIFGDVKNWTSGGVRGFFPYGWTGTIQAAAVCFWAFSGFELISCAVEETQNPKRNIPVATGVVMLLVTFLYISTASALSLMVPYSSLSRTTPLATVFVDIGQEWGRYFVSVGTLCAFTTSILSSFYGFVRIALAMAEDGLLFSWFRSVNARTKVPVLSAIFCGTVQSMVACCLDIKGLIEFSVNLILISYCSVCVSVIIISYRPQKDAEPETNGYIPLPEDDHDDDDDAVTDCVSTGTHRLRNDHAVTEDGTNKNRVKTDSCTLNKPSLDVLFDAHIIGDNATMSSVTQEGVNKEDGPTDHHCGHFDYEQNGSSLNDEQTDGALNDVHTLENKGTCNSEPEFVQNNDSRAVTFGYLRDTFVCLKPYMFFTNGRCALFSLGMMSLSMLGLSFCVTYAIKPVEHGEWWSVVLLCAAIFGIVVFLGIICVHKQTYSQVVLKMHCVPVVPSAALALSLMLLVANATKSSWIGCGVVLFFASVIYVSYSMRHSKLNREMYVSGDGSTLLMDHCETEEEAISNGV